MLSFLTRTPVLFRPQVSPSVVRLMSSSSSPKAHIPARALLFINNECTETVGGSYYDLIDPTNEEVLCQATEASADDVEAAVQAAHAAFKDKAWRKMSAADRGLLLHRLADLMEKNIEELSELEIRNSGKPYSEVRHWDLSASISSIRFFAGAADKITGKTIPADPNHLVMTFREPIGPCGVIIPWNYPLEILCWKLGPCLAAGNTVVVKPSEQTPLTALRLAEMAREVGFPKGVFNVVTGHGPTVGEALVKHPLISKVAFTGSTAVGHKVMSMCSEGKLKRLTLELGGKSPSIVFADADFQQAVDAAFMGLFANQGQCCCAGSRVLVQDSIYTQFVEAVVAKAKSRKVGDPLDPTVEQGPMVHRAQFEKTLEYVEVGLEDGATLAAGGKRHGKKGFFVEPTVFSDVTPNMRIAKEEIFGPVITILRFSTEEEAIEMANDTSYGLAGAVFTRDFGRAMRVSQEIKAGQVWINTYNAVFAQVPFGGYKESGLGRDLSEYALEHYTEVKAIVARL